MGTVASQIEGDCLLNRLSRRRSKTTLKLCVTGLCAGSHRGPVNSPHKWPVTRKMIPFDDVIMWSGCYGQARFSEMCSRWVSGEGYLLIKQPRDIITLDRQRPWQLCQKQYCLDLNTSMPLQHLKFLDLPQLKKKKKKITRFFRVIKIVSPCWMSCSYLTDIAIL